MSRSIKESITALTNARNDIVDALNSKIEGGGIEKSLKISEVAEKINSIEVGSSGNSNEIDLSQFKNRGNFGIIVLLTDILDYSITSVKINNNNISSSLYGRLWGTYGYVVCIYFDRDYPDPVSITIDIEYEGDTQKKQFNDISISRNKLTVIEEKS